MSKIEVSKACETIIFVSDNFRLKGNLHLPKRQKAPVVIGSHGLFADRRSPKQLALAQACTSAGMAYFRFDHRGCGESQGGFSQQVSFKARGLDLLKACEVMRQRKDTGEQIGLFGSSLGGAAVLFGASETGVESVVTYAAPVNSDCVVDALKNSGRSLPMDQSLIKDLLAFDLSNRLYLVKNIFVIHGESDEIVPVSHAKRILDGVSSPKNIWIQEQGDHRMSRKSHQKKFVADSVGWFNKFFAV